MIMWYPNLVLTGGSVYTGLSMLLTGRANAASWNGPTMEPLVIQPRSPCRKAPSRLSFGTQRKGGRVRDVTVGRVLLVRAGSRLPALLPCPGCSTNSLTH